MTVGLDDATVEDVLGSGLLQCPVIGCGEPLAPWGWARDRVVRGAGRLRPRRGRCPGCRRTQVLLPASVLLRRADAVTVIGAALLAKAGGAGHRRVAAMVGVPASTARGWLRRITAVADRVLAVLAAAARRARCRFPAAGAGGRPGGRGGGTGRGAGPRGGAAAGWFVGAVAVGRSAHRRPVAVSGWSGTRCGTGDQRQHELALGGWAITGWGVLIGPNTDSGGPGSERDRRS